MFLLVNLHFIHSPFCAAPHRKLQVGLGSMMRCAYTALLFAAAAQAFTLPGTPVTRTAGMFAFLCVWLYTFGTCKHECL